MKKTPLSHAKMGKGKALMVAVPAALGLGGVLIKAIGHGKNGKAQRLRDELQGVTDKLYDDLDITFSQVKDSIRGDSPEKLEKSIDSAVENAKERLDAVAADAKDGIRKAGSINY